ncbi:MAG: beta-glucoside operon transcriptional antiterminator [Clostridiales bacterium]|nr:beta-glucoside operon transcriptional antiterminator [Clostridiales bacterium]
MKIKKILNNNAVIAIDQDANEVVVTGSGLAFKKKIGDILDNHKVERIFRLEDQEVSRKLKKLIRDLPIKYVEISEAIIAMAKHDLGCELNENIYLTLTDHIHFLVERIEKKLAISNPLSWEIRRFYTEEYKVGVKAIEAIEKKLDIELPDEEAASIAMHIVNAELGEAMPNVVTMINIIQDTLSIMKYHYHIEFDEDSLYFQRLVTHLKFFAQRIISSQKNNDLGEAKDLAKDDADEKLFVMISSQYRESYACAQKIQKYAHEVHQFEINHAELTYLIVHIEKVIQSLKK